MTKDDDVGTIEKQLGIPDRSGDACHRSDYRRETSFDIVSSALTKTHQKALVEVEVILGDRKYVNAEVPRAIADRFRLTVFKVTSQFSMTESLRVGYQKTCGNYAVSVELYRQHEMLPNVAASTLGAGSCSASSASTLAKCGFPSGN